MSDLLPAESYIRLLTEGRPLIDLRAPVEFARGSFPAAVNLPLLNDSEREAVGKRYRQAGQEAAIALGQQLVGGATRQQRLTAWLEYVDRQPDAALFCFRGGLRSRTAQDWLAQAGYRLPRIAGGYKAMRRTLTESLEQVEQRFDLLILGGKTGCAKTDLINRLTAGVDLEGLACHRGSAFGRRVDPQPTQINFENRLAIQLLQKSDQRFTRLLLEDEGHAIGSLSIPLALFRHMRRAPLALLEQPLPFRVETVLHAYIEVNYRDFVAVDGANADQAFSHFLQDSLQRIQRRLGHDLYKEISADLNEALRQHLQHQDMTAHQVWIEKLLRLYYDPMYAFQLDKKLPRLVFRGHSDEFMDWARHLQWQQDARA